MTARIRVKLLAILFLSALTELGYGGTIIQYDNSGNNKIIAYGFSTEKDFNQAERKATIDAITEISDYFSGIKMSKKTNYTMKYQKEIDENLLVEIEQETGEKYTIYFKKKGVERLNGITKVIIEVSPAVAKSVIAIKDKIYMVHNSVSSVSCDQHISKPNCSIIKNSVLKSNNLKINNKSKLSLLIELGISIKIKNKKYCKIDKLGNAVFYEGIHCSGNAQYNFVLSLLSKATKNAIKKFSVTCLNVGLDRAIIKNNSPKIIDDNHCNIYSNVDFSL